MVWGLGRCRVPFIHIRSFLCQFILLYHFLPKQIPAFWSWFSSPSLFCVPSRVSRPDLNSSPHTPSATPKILIQLSASCCFRPTHPPSHRSSLKLIFPVWIVDGPIKLANAMVKVHSSALLEALSASIVPKIAYHGSSSLSYQQKRVHESLLFFCPNPEKCLTSTFASKACYLSVNS